jgi:cytochrome c553
MHRRLFVPLSLSLSMLGSSALAQTASGNAVPGKALFDNPATASGNPGLPTCASCHGSVEARRSVISQNSGGAADPYADISFEAAITRFTQALQNQQSMAAFRVLTAQQVYDIAAYLADTPKTNPVSETQLNFTAANNAFSTAQTVTLTHARATSENLVITDVAVFGAGASQFVVGNAAQCEGVTLQPGTSCQINVTYSPTTNAAATAELVLTMRQGPSTNPTFERVLPLSGSIAAAGGGGSSDDGGGALGLGWLLALGAAVAALSRRRA